MYRKLHGVKVNIYNCYKSTKTNDETHNSFSLKQVVVHLLKYRPARFKLLENKFLKSQFAPSYFKGAVARD
jgi:hypothetical protein